MVFSMQLTYGFKAEHKSVALFCQMPRLYNFWVLIQSYNIQVTKL